MNDRCTTLVATDKVVRLDSSTVLVYPGVTLTRYEHGHVIGSVWLPQGTEPSEADDELLIAYLREALRWSSGHDGAPAR